MQLCMHLNHEFKFVLKQKEKRKIKKRLVACSVVFVVPDKTTSESVTTGLASGHCNTGQYVVIRCSALQYVEIRCNTW